MIMIMIDMIIITLLDRFMRRIPTMSRTMVSGSSITHAVEPITCIESIEIPVLMLLSTHFIMIWLVVIALVTSPSRSFALPLLPPRIASV